MYSFQKTVEEKIRLGHITEYDCFYFDIVGMRQYNHRFGHDKGDEILRKYAASIRQSLPEEDALCHLGGDIFLALVKKEHMDRFVRALQDVSLEIVCDDETQDLHVSAVSGIYEINSEKITSVEIVRQAVAAEVHAKSIHRPFAVIDAAFEEELIKKRKLYSEIRKGLKDKEFIPFYQPKVDTKTHNIVGAEALARWRHDGKMVSPAVFIPEMENGEMICQLDFCILDRVCRDISKWIAEGRKKVEISVNFSRRNLADMHLAERINAVLEKYHVPKDCIQIEITETVHDPANKRIGSLVDELTGYGMSVAIDDFGSGSSSISLLKDAKFQVLKIDKTFVDYANEMEKNLLAHIIQMAKGMKLAVIAEGVENKDQVEELNKMGCYKIQGFLFGKPIEKEQFEKDWL